MNRQISLSSLSSAPSSDIRSLFQTTLEDYEKRTGINLIHHQLAIDLNSCDTADSIISTLRSHLQTLNNFRGEDAVVVIKWLKRIVRHLNTLSTNGVLGGESTRLLFPLENAILSSIGVLLVTIDGTQVSANYDILIDLFKSIESFLKRLATRIKTPVTASVIEMVTKILLELLSTLALATQQVRRGRLAQDRAEKLGDKLLGDNDIESVIERLGQFTQQGIRTAAAQTLDIIHGLVQNMKTLIDDGKASTDDIQYALGDQLLKDVRNWLSPSDPSQSHNIARKAHHTGTSTWFIEGHTFAEWKNTGSLLWIHGKPGSGKSVLCSMIIQEITRMRETGLASMAYFYFDRKNTEKQDACGLISSLLVQLSEQSEFYSDILSRLYSTHAAGSRQAGDDALLECLKDMLSVPGQGPIYIILDGLDESPKGPSTPSPRESVLEFIELLTKLDHSHLHICVSSCLEADIRSVLHPLTSQTVCLHEENGQIEDINNYINFFINSDVNTRQWKDDDKEFVIKKVSEEADGMFRWAFCRLDQLRRCLPRGIRGTLDEFPETMEYGYERILLDIDEKKWEAAHLLFRCIAVATRPLRVSELADFLALDYKLNELPVLEAGWRPKDPEYAVLATCSSFISIEDANESPPVVHFSHFSVKKYLTSNNLDRADRRVSRYSFSIEDAHTTVAHGCLSTLLHVDEKVNRSSITNFPLAAYAAQYLVTHTSFLNVQRCVRDSLKRLLDPHKPHFAIWVWIYDVDEYSGQSMTSETPSQPRAGPLYYASQFRLNEIVIWLSSTYPSSINGLGGYYGTPLIAACAKGHADIAGNLLYRGGSHRTEGPDGRTALYSASENGHLNTVESLLERHADPNTLFMGQYSPLGQALRNGHLEVARLLIQHKAQVNQWNSLGETVLHQASNGGYDLESIQFLLRCGANTGCKDRQGRTALDIARESGQEEIVQLLLGHDANTMH
ncbi:hypothetical protein B0F90DRAFT_1671154 [Multifurca ochricompacta]|uniref:NACHT domain-containing protein n=1 Tax=Multifurca ochricompacta TaxID=376703 RepID=A0AAD4LW62_9AGAM|nr:hypothetical protein B0F90DRAFT_1671154 [Multifurca ochricompacta]